MKRAAFIAAVLLLAVYAIIFPLLTIDTLGLILGKAAVFETRNLLLVLYLEVTRLFTTLVLIAIALVLALRGAARQESRALALCLLFAVIAYEKAFGVNGLPGPVQERVANGLLAMGARRELLRWLFGPAAWPVWPALAALLRFSAVFPRPLDPDMLRASGAQDRRGFMRGSGVAGADIGAFFRAFSLLLLRSNMLKPVALAAIVLAVVAASTLVSGLAWLWWLLAALLCCAIITNLRAAYAASHGEDRVRMMWLVEGFVLATVLLLLSGTLLLLVDTSFASTTGFILAMLAPVAFMVCVALSVLDRGELKAGDAIDATVRTGSLALTLLLVFGVLYRLLTALTVWLGWSSLLAAGLAVVVVVLAQPVLQRATERLRLRILEQDRAAL